MRKPKDRTQLELASGFATTMQAVHGVDGRYMCVDCCHCLRTGGGGTGYACMKSSYTGGAVADVKPYGKACAAVVVA